MNEKIRKYLKKDIYTIMFYFRYVVRRISEEMSCKKFIPNRKQVVLVDAHATIRGGKIAWGLYKSGMEVIVIISRDRRGIYTTEGRDKNCHKIILYDSINEALFFCTQYHPLVYHVLVNFNVGYELAVKLIQHKIGKIVFDNYDGLKGFYAERVCDANEKKLKIYQEKYCLEHADGICCRNLSSQYHKHHLGYKIIGKRVLFLDYCWDNIKESNNNKNIAADEELLIYNSQCVLPPKEIWGGEVYSSYHPEARNYRYYLFIGFSSNVRTKDSPMDQVIKRAKNNPFFNVSNRVPYKQLLRIGTRMHYIDLITGKQENMTEVYQNEIPYSCSNRFFDAIDCGTPIICRGLLLIEKYLERRKMAYIVQGDDLDNRIKELKENYNELHNSMGKYRNELSIKSNIPRLVKFYYSL